MAPIYSQLLLEAVIDPSSSASVILPDPWTWIVRDVMINVRNGEPDTGGGFVEISLGTIFIAECRFPGAYMQLRRWEMREVAPGPTVLSADCGGGGSMAAQVRVSGYRLTPP